MLFLLYNTKYMKKLKSELRGKRVILKKFKPTISAARILFKVVDKNREHLNPWFPWVKEEKKVEEAFQYLLEVDKKFKDGTKFDYGIYLNGEYIGNVGLFDVNQKNKSGEIGYWLSKEFTRRGYMTEAVGVLEKEAFVNGGLNRIQIKCDERNIPSAKTAKKCGYLFEGKHREDSYSEHFKDFRNTLYFSKLKSDFKNKKK